MNVRRNKKNLRAALSLDEMTSQAVRQYRSKPPMLDGKADAVEMNVAVNSQNVEGEMMVLRNDSSH